MSQKDFYRLSVIIPVYNEERRLGPTLARLGEYLSGQPYEWELVVVDDGSADRSVEIAEQAGLGDRLRVLKQEVNQGKGAAVRAGMAVARGEFALFSDSDLSTPIEEIEKFWPSFEQGFDVVIGSRGLSDSRIEVRQRWYREMMGRMFNQIVQLLVLPGIHDTQCGFKMFTRRAYQALFPRLELKGWAFDVELLALARREGFRIAEVPVRWLNSPDTRVRTFSASSQMFMDLLRLRRRLRSRSQVGSGG